MISTSEIEEIYKWLQKFYNQQYGSDNGKYMHQDVDAVRMSYYHLLWKIVSAKVVFTDDNDSK